MTANEKTRTLKQFVGMLSTGDPLRHLHLTLVPLRGELCGSLDYLLAQDAIASGLLTVTEVSESGSVPELAVFNAAGAMALLVDGEELVGAKQNRILNTTVLLPAHAKTRIPVSCVEQGRWRHVSSQFSSGEFSSASLRRRKSRSVGRNLRESGVAMSDQGEVWDAVACNIQAADAASPTMALHDAISQRRDTLDDYLRALPFVEGSRGVVAAIAGVFVAIDLFDKPDTLRRLWPRLITGYALDALGRPDGPAPEFTANGARALIEHIGELAGQPCPSAGLGEDWRFESPAIIGQALVFGRLCVHLSAFPNDADGVQGQRLSHIQRPSRRRQHRRNEGEQRIY